MSLQRIGTTRRYSDLVIHNGVLHTVEVPASDATDIVSQTRAVLAGLDRLLAQGGTDRSKLLMATIYLTDMADYAAVNALWDEWLPEGSAPCRACVQVAALAQPDWRIEIALTAACA